MNLLTQHELRTLMKAQGEHLVSILMRTHRSGPATRQHRLRFKSLLGLVDQRLQDAGLRQPDINARLEPAQKLLYDGLFWSHQGRGLALYLGPEEHHILRLPLPVPELAVVSPRFHIKPLIPLISDEGRFYLLTTSRKRLRFYQGSRHSLLELGLEGVQGSLREALRGHNSQGQLQFHTGSQARTGSRRRAAVYHGHGAGKDGTKERILHYFHQVDEAVRSTLSGEEAPLVVAAVNYYQPIYAEANSYPFLAAWLTGSPGQWSTTQLHRQAWEAVAVVFTEAQRAAAERFRQMEGSGLTLHTLEAILPAAHRGQVEALFVAVGIHQWGRFDPHAGEFVLHDGEEPSDEDLLDLAAVQTFLHEGTVHAVAPEDVPGGGALAAILRWKDTL